MSSPLLLSHLSLHLLTLPLLSMPTRRSHESQQQHRREYSEANDHEQTDRTSLFVSSTFSSGFHLLPRHTNVRSTMSHDRFDVDRATFGFSNPVRSRWSVGVVSHLFVTEPLCDPLCDLSPIDCTDVSTVLLTTSCRRVNPPPSYPLCEFKANPDV